jgi:microsomal epoxide hydrolase
VIRTTTPTRAAETKRPPPGAVAFRIDVTPHVLDDLQARLARTRWTSVSPDAGWEHGTSRTWLRDLVRYWRSGYDWRAQEARLNAFAQFKASIEGSEIHFVHEKARRPGAMPLLLLHGWPDSFDRFHKIVPTLVDPAPAGGDPDDVFDVVVPSLPGFAFTGPLRRVASVQPMRQSARLLWQLMTKVLAYQRFAVAGGDGGSVLAQILAIDHPESVIAVHLTDLGWHTTKVDARSLSRAERHYLEQVAQELETDGAYAMVQMTRPHSLAPGLEDSPVGLASWILDRFHAWCDGHDPVRSFGRDDLLTNVMLYWVTRSVGPSLFNYCADARSPSLTSADRVTRPVGLALFPRDIGGVPPRVFAERTLRVMRWTEMPRGGHFAALEEPELYVRDLVEFLREHRAEDW